MMNVNFTKTLIARERGKEIYRVANTEGMTEREILDACANDWYYGGRVLGTEVTIYIDWKRGFTQWKLFILD